MSFKDLSLNSSYNSSRNNLVEEFYIPILSESVSYDRVTGFFNSNSLALASRGLKKFIVNGGKMRLLCGSQLSPEDLDSILNASEIVSLLEDNFLDDLNSVNDEIQLNHLKLLAWMVDKDILEIKIGIVKNYEGYVGGILHEKTGILRDNLDNIIVFSGSNNETMNGWSSQGFGNIEKFKVFSSWEDKKFMDEELDYFEEDWNNNNQFLEVFDVPKAAKEGLIKLSPNTIEEVMRLPLSENELKKSVDGRELRGYQKEAISNWINNGKKGIFEMATGTGKTFTALNCISNIFEDNSASVVVIACPYAHLVEQWAEDVELFFEDNCYRLYGSVNSNWKKDLTSLVFRLNHSIIKKAIILTTHKTFSSELFIRQISKIKNNSFLIVDEMHHVVANSYRLGLLKDYDYNLGLSATPYVYNNEEGTEFLLSYFNGVVYKFGLEEALITTDENNETFLAPYDYFPIKIEFNSEELRDYIDLSDKISRASFSNNEEMSDYYKTLLYQRKSIVNNAEEKYNCLRKILKSYTHIDHLIVFCSSQQMDTVLNILKEEEVYPRHKFTQEEGTTKSKQFDGLSQREYLVKRFDEGYFKALVAIKCLDEGVDIPSANKVIIMSSSNNPREYVQRRGRVLRRCEGKDKAEIYDMAVITKDEYGNLIKQLADSESNRLLDFIYTSENQGYCVDLLEKWGIL